MSGLRSIAALPCARLRLSGARSTCAAALRRVDRPRRARSRTSRGSRAAPRCRASSRSISSEGRGDLGVGQHAGLLPLVTRSLTSSSSCSSVTDMKFRSVSGAQGARARCPGVQLNTSCWFRKAFNEVPNVTRGPNSAGAIYPESAYAIRANSRIRFDGADRRPTLTQHAGLRPFFVKSRRIVPLRPLFSGAWLAMTDDKPGVMGNLPRSRPGRRSDKRSGSSHSREDRGPGQEAHDRAGVDRRPEAGSACSPAGAAPPPRPSRGPQGRRPGRPGRRAGRRGCGCFGLRTAAGIVKRLRALRPI